MRRSGCTVGHEAIAPGPWRSPRARDSVVLASSQERDLWLLIGWAAAFPLNGTLALVRSRPERPLLGFIPLAASQVDGQFTPIGAREIAALYESRNGKPTGNPMPLDRGP